MNATDGQQIPNGGNVADDTPEALDQQTVAESPLPPPSTDGVYHHQQQQDGARRTADPEEEESSRDHRGIWRHVTSSSDREEVHVILHGATNLPATTGSTPPMAYAAVKTKSSDDQNSLAEFVTSFHPTPSFSASWESFGIVSIDERRSSEEVLIFKLMDATTKQVLARYHLPVNYLQPFHQYHLEMVMPSVSSSQGVLLFASITRKLSFIPKTEISPKYLGIEVLLQQVNEEFDQPVGPITAVARVISSYYSYADDLFSSHHRMDWSYVLGVSAKTVLFPNPHKSLFMPSASHLTGSPQVTLPGGPEQSPTWNHCFMFVDDRDSATLFNPHCALLIEFYRSRAQMTELSWRLTNPLGFCVIPIDHDLYRCLTPSVTKGATAVRIKDVPIQKCPLLTTEKKNATISLVLRLINSQRPDSLKDLADLDELPVLSVNQQLVSPMMDFPSHGAMEDILQPKQPTTNNKKSPEEDIRADSSELKRDDSADRLSSSNILDFQLKELNAYRDAIRRMEHDIVSLHEQVRLLQTTNDRLRRQLDTTGARSARTPPAGGGGGGASARKFPGEEKENDGSKKRSRKEVEPTMEDDHHLWDRNESEEKYDLMMKRVNRQSHELKEYREKVLKLQNELIQKNEKEKDLLRKGVGGPSGNSFRELEKQVQAKTAKIRGLEEAYRNQEKIIDKMEKLLETKHNKGDKDVHVHVEDVRSKIMEENKRLRHENQMLTEQNRLMTKNRKDEEEMMQLQQKLEKDAERIRTLEQKMVENARRWAHEKTDLQTRLEEAEHGFRRTSVLDRPPRVFATQQNVSPSPSTEKKLKQNKSSKRLPSIYT